MPVLGWKTGNFRPLRRKLFFDHQGQKIVTFQMGPGVARPLPGNMTIFRPLGPKNTISGPDLPLWLESM